MRKTNDNTKCLMGGVCNIAGASDREPMRMGAGCVRHNCRATLC